MTLNCKNININVGENMTTSVGMNSSETIGMNSSQSVGMNVTESIGAMKMTSVLRDASPKSFKAFYFAENGYSPSGGYVSGFSAAGADYVVVFKSRNNQTASHEFLHSMNLPHTFTNKQVSVNAKFTYEFSKTDNLLDYSHRLITGNNNNRCSLFYWLWKQSNDSIK